MRRRTVHGTGWIGSSSEHSQPPSGPFKWLEFEWERVWGVYLKPIARCDSSMTGLREGTGNCHRTEPIRLRICPRPAKIETFAVGRVLTVGGGPATRSTPGPCLDLPRTHVEASTGFEPVYTDLQSAA